MNLKRIATLVTVVFSAYSLASCSSQVNQPLLTDPNVSISSKNSVSTPEEAIKQFSNAYAQLNDFTGIVSIEDSKNGDPNNVVKGDSKFFFKKDRNERVEITKSDDNQKVGSVLAYKGGDKVVVLLAKAIPILGKKFTLSISDKRIATSRGLAFDQMDLTAMLNRFNKPGVQLSLLPASTNKGRSIIRISGKGTFKGIDSEITEEILSLDSETMLPVQDQSLVQTKTVLKISVSDLKLNVGLKDDIFNL